MSETSILKKESGLNAERFSCSFYVGEIPTGAQSATY